jgi:hypothetical protein
MGIRNSEALVESHFHTDGDGNPTGGETKMVAPGAPDEVALLIRWQDGIVGDNDQSGAFVEDVLEAARQRLLFFNSTRFRCRENSIAITKIEETLQWLDWRTRQRLLQDMENTYKQHTDKAASTSSQTQTVKAW